MQMFIWNNIFFSLGFDVATTTRTSAGTWRPTCSARTTWNGVRTHNAVDVEGLYTLGTVVVDYRGHVSRPSPSSPASWSGTRSRVSSSTAPLTSARCGVAPAVPGAAGAHKPAPQDPEAPGAQRPGRRSLCSSVECKGIIGNDGRHYILDLLLTSRPQLPARARRRRCPRSAPAASRAHRHKLCCLRQELVDAFVEHRWGTGCGCSLAQGGRCWRPTSDREALGSEEERALGPSLWHPASPQTDAQELHVDGKK